MKAKVDKRNLGNLKLRLARTWQRGDCGMVFSVLPRKRIIWLDTDYGFVAVRPQEWTVDRVSPELPDSFISDYERRMGAGVGKVLEEALG